MSAEKKKVHSSMPGENIQINEIKKWKVFLPPVHVCKW
jgi:hypothetical protein